MVLSVSAHVLDILVKQNDKQLSLGVLFYKEEQTR